MGIIVSHYVKAHKTTMWYNSVPRTLLICSCYCQRCAIQWQCRNFSLGT